MLQTYTKKISTQNGDSGSMLRNKSDDVGFGVLYGGSAKLLPLDEYMVRKDLNMNQRALFEKHRGESLVSVTQFTAFNKQCIQKLLQQWVSTTIF